MGATESMSHDCLPDEEPQPGDLIEIFREGYKHWALYTGGGNVIHMIVPVGAPGVSKKGLVKKEPLLRVAAGGMYRIRKKYDERYNCRSRRQILYDAEVMVGSWMDYDLFANNCEYFTPGFRHEIRRRQQEEDGLTAGQVLGVGLAVVGVVGVAGALMAALESPKTEEDQRRKEENSGDVWSVKEKRYPR